MRLLLDTHTWLWFVLGDASLSSTARGLIEDPNHEKLISPVSYWELAIQVSLGKYSLPTVYDTFVTAAIAGQGFVILPVLPAHTAAVCSLPFHHRDPFDRLLVAQSLSEGVPLVSCDLHLDRYSVQRYW